MVSILLQLIHIQNGITTQNEWALNFVFHKYCLTRLTALPQRVQRASGPVANKVMANNGESPFNPYFYILKYLPLLMHFLRQRFFIIMVPILLTCKGLPYNKNEYNLFHPKLDAEYFLINNFSRKQQYFPRKQWETVLGAHLTIFTRLLLDHSHWTHIFSKVFWYWWRYL